MREDDSVVEVMTKDPFTVKVHDRLCDIIDLLQNVKFEHLPVVDEIGHLKGIVSKTDIYKKVLFLTQQTSGKAFTNKTLFITKAKDIMHLKPVTVEVSASIAAATELLLQHDFHALPVLEDKKVVGILTAKDILSAHSRNKGNY